LRIASKVFYDQIKNKVLKLKVLLKIKYRTTLVLNITKSSLCTLSYQRSWCNEHNENIMVREISSKHTKQINYCFETLANFIKQVPTKGENKKQTEKSPSLSQKSKTQSES
jgi:hypothetical protein